MANKDDVKQVPITTSENYLDQVREAFSQETKQFDAFYEKIRHHADTHRQITLNNVNEVEERLQSLREQAKQIKHSLFFHEEYAIVDRQEIIASTESKVGEENFRFLSSYFTDQNEILDSFDYLNKAILKSRTDFFEEYERAYLSNIIHNESFFAYFDELSQEFDGILERHQEEIMNLFLRLDEDIKNMDASVAEILQKKNKNVADSKRFFEAEMKNFIDNQLLFSVELDPTSIDIQAIVSDKINQFEAFRLHLSSQRAKTEALIQKEYDDLYQKTLQRELSRISNELTGERDFFDDPEALLEQLKTEMLEANSRQDKIALTRAVKLYEKLKKHRKIRKNAEQRIHRSLNAVSSKKRAIYKEYLLETEDVLLRLEQNLDLYRNLMNKDPFLAQAIGDDSSKIIKDELNRLSILQANKELKLNIDYDIASLKIKNRINAVELELSYEVKRQLLLQESELLATIAKANRYLKTFQAEYLNQKIGMQKNALLIERIEKATNTHLTYLHESGDIRRKIQAASIALSVKDIRSGETHRMHVAESASKIKLKLKEYDIQAIHFKTMLENETAYLVSQSSRVGEEVQINNAFILTTYENQMRFSSEQVRLADEEFKLRVTAIQRANEEEKRYFDDLIQHQLRSYETALQTENHAYEAKLYQNRHMLSQTTDPKIHKILEKEAKELQKNHDAYIAQHHKKIRDDQLIQRAKARIADLEEEYLDAVDDAVNLRDETVQEMSSLYEESKERYLALKPYLESKMNVLDPSFFEHLKRIESRYSYRIKLAEAKLDEETQQLLEEYRQVSFESLEAKALDEHLTQMNEYERLKLDCEQRYANAMKQIESEYQASVQKLDETAKSGASQLEIVASAFLQKSNAILTQYQKNLSALDEQRKQSVIHLDDQLQKQIIKLKSEYDNAITENQRFVEALSTNFEKLLSSYRGYLRTTGKDKDIVSIRKENKKRYTKARKGRFHHLQSDSKQFLQHKEKSTSR